MASLPASAQMASDEQGGVGQSAPAARAHQADAAGQRELPPKSRPCGRTSLRTQHQRFWRSHDPMPSPGTEESETSRSAGSQISSLASLSERTGHLPVPPAVPSSASSSDWKDHLPMPPAEPPRRRLPVPPPPGSFDSACPAGKARAFLATQ